jgi:hypothetical protein
MLVSLLYEIHVYIYHLHSAHDIIVQYKYDRKLYYNEFSINFSLILRQIWYILMIR